MTEIRDKQNISLSVALIFSNALVRQMKRQKYNTSRRATNALLMCRFVYSSLGPLLLFFHSMIFFSHPFIVCLRWLFSGNVFSSTYTPCEFFSRLRSSDNICSISQRCHICTLRTTEIILCQHWSNINIRAFGKPASVCGDNHSMVQHKYYCNATTAEWGSLLPGVE